MKRQAGFSMLFRRNLLSSNHMDLELWKTFGKAFVWIIFLYESDTGEIEKPGSSGATKMSTWIRMMMTSWIGIEIYKNNEKRKRSNLLVYAVQT